jgi:hypothetical protein
MRRVSRELTKDSPDWFEWTQTAELPYPVFPSSVRARATAVSGRGGTSHPFKVFKSPWDSLNSADRLDLRPVVDHIFVAILPRDQHGVVPFASQRAACDRGVSVR